MIAVRISIYDQPPILDLKFDSDLSDFHFGALVEGREWESDEPIRFLQLCQELGIELVNITAGTPYYCAHLQRPAAYPPIDSTESKRDPLIGVIKQIHATAECKRAVPDLSLVGSAYSYLQEYLPHVAQAQVREGNVDFVGLGRMILAYPTLPDDVLSKGTLKRPRICRTFSDCTNGPRMGFISGCFPLDPVYKELPEWKQIRGRKKAMAIKVEED